MLKGKKILLGITGSIAAYKSIVLTRLLTKAGAEIKIITTPAALDFVPPLTLSTLSRNPVITELSAQDEWANHVMLGRWADLMLIAPLSCNTLAKMSAGICDNLLMAVYLSATCPVLVAPAMDEDMWKHPSTKRNLDTIRHFGNQVVPVESGELASGLVGYGRMAEPERILQSVLDFFSGQDLLKGKNVLITAGPTFEPIDPVRFIGNHSSGKMGIALAETCKQMGADVTLVCGPVKESMPVGVNTIKVSTADEMYQAALEIFRNSDIAIMSAAVADYKVKEPSTQKIKKQTDRLELVLEKTTDILKSLGAIKEKHQTLVGFALETNDEEKNAQKKLQDKNADLIVLNSLNDQGAGFGGDHNKITIFDRKGNTAAFDLKSKKEVAADIVHSIINYRNA